MGVINSGCSGEIIFKFRVNLPIIDWLDHQLDDSNKDCTSYLEKSVLMFIDHTSPTSYIKEHLEIYALNDKIGQIIILPYPQIKFLNYQKLVI